LPRRDAPGSCVTHPRKKEGVGKAGVFPLNLYARVRILDAQFAHETAGAASTRSSLRPLSFKRDRFQANLGRSAPREREVIFVSGLLFRSSLRGAKRRSNPLFLLRGASIASLRLHDGRMWRLQLHSRSSRPSQHATRHSEISLMETKRRGILDAFARGMTASWEYGIETKLNPAR